MIGAEDLARTAYHARVRDRLARIDTAGAGVIRRAITVAAVVLDLARAAWRSGLTITACLDVVDLELDRVDIRISAADVLRKYPGETAETRLVRAVRLQQRHPRASIDRCAEVLLEVGLGGGRGRS
jgi:hypothetical protein